jgi:hypothetical protein
MTVTDAARSWPHQENTPSGQKGRKAFFLKKEAKTFDPGGRA